MAGAITENVKELTKKVMQLYEEAVRNAAQFEELRESTKSTLDQFKHLLERFSDKLEQSEKERVKSEADLAAEMKALTSRLDIISEKALHASIREAAEAVAKELLTGRKVRRIDFSRVEEHDKTQRSLPADSQEED